MPHPSPATSPTAADHTAHASERARELEAQVLHHNRLYWDEQQPEISDTDFDRLVRELKELAPDSDVLNALGPSQRFGAAVQHSAPMLSLDKCYTDAELSAWMKDVSGAIVAIAKFDGIACSLQYDAQGKLVRAATRGDGTTGDDITQNARLIAGIPKQLPHAGAPLDVRGEIYMRLSVFEKFKQEGMANPRNLAAGAIKQKDAAKSASYGLSFAAYDIVGSELSSLAAMLDTLPSLGFDPIAYTLIERGENDERRAAQCYQDFQTQRSALDYEIDGVVFKASAVTEQKRLGLTAHHPRYAIAYKFQGDSGSTTLTAVEWSVARTGAITPVAIVAPVALSGVTVSRASLHNVAFIERLQLSEGATVTLVRRGGVIPHVENVIAPGTSAIGIPTQCPSCAAPTVRERDFLYCSAPVTCKRVLIGQLAHFCTVTEIMGFGDALLEAAFNAQLVRDSADLYALTAESLAELDRSGKKLATKLVAEIAAKRQLTLSVFLRALGIADLGKHVADVLADRYATLEAVRAVGREELAAIHGIGDITATNVVDGLTAMAPLIDRLLAHVTVTSPASKVEGKLSGFSFVFTGKMASFSRSDAEKQVRARGGNVLSAVSTSLTYLVIGDDKTGGPSTKQKAAEKLITKGASIQVISETDLLAMLRD